MMSNVMRRKRRNIHYALMNIPNAKAVAAHALHLCLLLVPLISTAISIAHAQVRQGFQDVIIRSDDRQVGERFTFANLSSKRPIVTFPSGNADEYVKVFEDDSLLVLVLVAHLTGSTETFHIAKKAGHFTLVEVGALEALSLGNEFRPRVTYGRLVQ